MVAVRYTVGGYGIFASLKKLYEADADTGMNAVDWNDLEAIENKFDRELELPELCRDYEERKKYRSYFTKEGYVHFRREIERLLDIYTVYVDVPEAEYREINDSDRIAYQDEFQILVPV